MVGDRDLSEEKVLDNPRNILKRLVCLLRTERFPQAFGIWNSLLLLIYAPPQKVFRGGILVFIWSDAQNHVSLTPLKRYILGQEWRQTTDRASEGQLNSKIIASLLGNSLRGLPRDWLVRWIQNRNCHEAKILRSRKLADVV